MRKLPPVGSFGSAFAVEIAGPVWLSWHRSTAMTPPLSKIVGWSLLLILLGTGCNRPEPKIERTKKQYKASEVRAALIPLFRNYHYDGSQPSYGPPNYPSLNPVPKEVADLPIFADLAAQQEVIMGVLENDTNALIIFTQRGMDKWGIVIHRSSIMRELPKVSGQQYSFWDDGIFFYIGSTMPD
jgi:hypothetical protein